MMQHFFSLLRITHQNRKQSNKLKNIQTQSTIITNFKIKEERL